MLANAGSENFTRFMRHVSHVDGSSFANEHERQQAVAAARRLLQRVETPEESLWNMAVNTPAVCTAAKLGIDLGLFKELEANKGVPQSSSQLGSAVNAQSSLILRILRHLAANGLVSQTGPDKFDAVPLTQLLSTERGTSTIRFLFDIQGPGMLRLPSFLDSTGYREPQDVDNGNWQWTTGTDMNLFQWFSAYPLPAKTYQRLMRGPASANLNWTDQYPTDILMQSSLKGEDDIVLVDVGGNTGKDMLYFLNKHPCAKNHIVVQDLPNILHGVRFPQGVIAQPHNFFNLQPIQNARAYFLRSILHEWPDRDAVQILRNLRPVFGPRSRLLVNDIVMKPVGAPPQQTAMDLTMVAATSSKERTQEMWADLLAKGGFEIKRIYEGHIESIIEATPI